MRYAVRSVDTVLQWYCRITNVPKIITIRRVSWSIEYGSILDTPTEHQYRSLRRD
jgi:hypothetical protein